GLVARIDQDGAICRLVHDEIRILLKRSDRERLELHAVYPPDPTIGSLGSPSASALRYFSAAMAAVVASPTAVVTWRVSCARTSPAANNPRMLVCMFASVSKYPMSSWSTWPSMMPVFGRNPTNTNTPVTARSRGVFVVTSRNLTLRTRPLPSTSSTTWFQ